MVQTTASGKLFRFGMFEADSSNGTLTRNGSRIKIQEQPFRLLLILLNHPGEIVTREELRQQLWPEGTFVDFDGSLNVLLKRLRATIGDDPENPRFIETVPRRGYRFIAPVALVPPKPEPAALAGLDGGSIEVVPEVPPALVSLSLPVAPVASKSKPRRWIAIVIVAACAAAVLGGWMLLRHRFGPQSATSKAPVQMRKSVAVLGFQNLSPRAAEAWLGTALSEMLSTELAGGEKLRMVSGEDVTNLQVSAPWPVSDTLDRVTSTRIGDA